MLSDFVWAAEQRFQEAEELFVSRRFSGALYLLGLSAEMWLKLAAIHCHDRRVTAATSVAAHLGPIRLWMAVNFPLVQCESYHSVSFWAEYIIGFRARSGMPLPANTIGELRHHAVRRLFEDWRIELRYRAIPVSERHCWRAFQDVLWMRRNWTRFWR